jgi:hypothetical protein
MVPKIFLGLLLLVTLGQAVNVRPHILFIVADDLGGYCYIYVYMFTYLNVCRDDVLTYMINHFPSPPQVRIPKRARISFVYVCLFVCEVFVVPVIVVVVLDVSFSFFCFIIYVLSVLTLYFDYSVDQPRFCL